MNVDLEKIFIEVFNSENYVVKCIDIKYHYHIDDGTPKYMTYSLNQYHTNQERMDFLRILRVGALSLVHHSRREKYGECLVIKVWLQDGSILINNNLFNFIENNKYQDFLISANAMPIPLELKLPNLSRDTSDDQLCKCNKLMSKLEDGHVLVLEKKLSNNPKQTIIYTARLLLNLPSDNIKGEFDLFGFGNKILRTHIPFKNSIADTIKLGDSLNEFSNMELDYEITDSYTPKWSGHKSRVFINNFGKTEELYDIKEYSKKVYRHCRIKTKDKGIKHTLIIVKPASMFTSSEKHLIAIQNSSFYQNQKNYEQYNGIYGYDDDTIDDAFEGDPSNYWNID